MKDLMITQLETALRGEISPQMISAAAAEKVPVENVRDAIRSGAAVLPANTVHRSLKPVVVGRSFRTKVNANIGFSTERSSVEEELEKLRIVIATGADFVMDLSVGSGTSGLRSRMLEQSPLPFGTVPLYEAFWRTGGDTAKLNIKLILEVIREQAEQGVDFMTLHAGLLKAHTRLAAGRMMGIVSRGGAILAEWMTIRGEENPLFTSWNDVLEICRKHDVTVSLGDGLRPGCLADASDEAQFAELDVLGDLVLKCRERGVQVMVEGPGHVPFNQIQMNMERERRKCHDAPFYVLGPVVTDVAPGYDHITSSIGSTAAAFYGASLLCYVTPSEHLGLPTIQDVREGIIAHRIAAHAADVARGLPGAREWDDAMSRARMNFDWEKQFAHAMDGDEARRRHKAAAADHEGGKDYCSMCGKDFCSIRTTARFRSKILEQSGSLKAQGEEPH